MIDFDVLGISVGVVSLVAIAGYCSWEVVRRRRVEVALRQQQARENLVHQISQHIRQSLNLDEVLATTVREVQGFLNADRVLIYRVWEDGTGCAIHETVLPPYPKILGQTFPEEVFPIEYHRAYLQGKTLTISDIDREEVETCLVDFIKHFGVRAKLVVPIIQQQRDEGGEATIPYLWGLLIAHQCSYPRQWVDWEVDLMQQLATQVAIAIQQSELYNQLQQLNAQLELRVQHRTAELAQANISLRYTNDTLQALIAASPRAIVMLDLEGKVKIWNPAAEHMFGWSEGEVLDRPNPILLESPPSDYPTLQESILQGTTYSRLELRCETKDGTAIDIIFSAAPLPNSEGKIDGIVAVIADITAEKQQAAELRLLQSVVVNTNDAAIVTEAEPIDFPGPRILYVNEAFTRITGYQPHEILGKSPRILQGAKTDRAEIAKVRHALAHWESITVEVINYRKDGSEFWNEFSLVPVADGSGKYTHWISVQRDTTERKRLDEIRLALEREKELSAMKTRFFSMVSHEFRTPLSTALAAAQVLENSPAKWDNSTKRLRNLHRIQDAIRQMVQLLDDILTINRAETGKLAFNPQSLDLEYLCYELVEEMRLNVGKQHTLTFACQGTSSLINGDEKLIRSILANLLANGIKYSPQGGDVSLVLTFQPDRVQLMVRDRGIGIAPSDREHLFEPFYRGKNVRTIPGTGLGLAVVKKCVDLHQGKIEITSEVGAGTTCAVFLPLSPPSQG
jgi:PAS domain S-box-containing protein